MFVTDGVFTREVAAAVGSMLKYLFEHPEDDRYFELHLIRHHPDGDREWTEHIRLASDEGRVVTLANGREIVRCTTSNGKKLDIWFGEVAERELEPALVIIES